MFGGIPMSSIKVVTIAVLMTILILTSLAGYSFAEDRVPFENDTKETATVLTLNYMEDSISMMDYFDYYLLESEYIYN